MSTTFCVRAKLEQKWAAKQHALINGYASDVPSRLAVMKELLGLFQSCYGLGAINPLTGVRRAFPGLKWTYWKREGVGAVDPKLNRELASMDIIWVVSVVEFVGAEFEPLPFGGRLQDVLFLPRRLDYIAHMSRCGFDWSRMFIDAI